MRIERLIFLSLTKEIMKPKMINNIYLILKQLLDFKIFSNISYHTIYKISR